mmetsp:Transcript_25612/g.75597  ORF Transcript_25612/g.75597 Transcript_25612/m.75597 type:complete len:100 (-) Transcript_25612:72-371(-)
MTQGGHFDRRPADRASSSSYRAAAICYFVRRISRKEAKRSGRSGHREGRNKISERCGNDSEGRSLAACAVQMPMSPPSIPVDQAIPPMVMKRRRHSTLG